MNNNNLNYNPIAGQQSDDNNSATPNSTVMPTNSNVAPNSTVMPTSSNVAPNSTVMPTSSNVAPNSTVMNTYNNNSILPSDDNVNISNSSFSASENTNYNMNNNEIASFNNSQTNQINGQSNNELLNTPNTVQSSNNKTVSIKKTKKSHLSLIIIFVVLALVVAISTTFIILNNTHKNNTNVNNIDSTTKITLEQIATKFNNNSTVKEYATYGSVWNATVNGNVFEVTIVAAGNTSKLEYTLDGNILSSKFEGANVLIGGIVSVVIEDCIGQLHGYQEGEIASILNSDEVENYTVKKEGFEINKLNDSILEVKMDITKKLPHLDKTNAYFEVSDLKDFEEFISGDGSAQKSKGNVFFWKGGFDDDVTLIIAEEQKLTNNSYKSILSILEVMFGTKNAAKYFEKNYNSISEENKEFNGFKIEVNPVKDEMEEFMLGSNGSYKFLRITIDKALVNSVIR